MKKNQVSRCSRSPRAISQIKALIRRLRKRYDPVYASARPWDWKICRRCRQLVHREGNRCMACGGRRFNIGPLEVFRRGFQIHGTPPSLLD